MEQEEAEDTAEVYSTEHIVAGFIQNCGAGKFVERKRVLDTIVRQTTVIKDADE